MSVDAYASQPQYWRHLRPIVEGLHLRDHAVTVWAPAGVAAPWADAELRNPRDVADVVLVAAEIDARTFVGHRPVVYVEHGAGQTYVDGEGEGTGYAGGPRLDHCALFLCPSERVAIAWQTTYPMTPAVAIGCPALDDVRNKRSPLGVVYVTSHWNCGVNPESRPALSHHASALPELRAVLAGSGHDLIGHAHPREARRAAERWRSLGIPYQPNPDRVLQTADCIIADNTSLLYEAAALDIPVVVLNAPWYRRDVEHGLRFWSHVPGIQVDDPLSLTASVAFALRDHTGERALRARAAQYAYAAPPGEATDLACDAIESLLTQPTRTRENPMAEIQGRLAEMLERGRLLGASDEQIAWLRNEWDTLDADEQETLFRANDQVLGAQFRGEQIEDAEAELGDSAAAHAVHDYTEVRESQEDEDWGTLGLAIPTIMEAVGDDAEHAHRLYRLEQTAEQPRTTLLARLEAIAWPNGKPVPDANGGATGDGSGE